MTLAPDEKTDIEEMLILLDPVLWLVTSANESTRAGLIATFACPASIVPDQPRMMLGLANHHHTWEIVEETGRFAMHLISPDQIDLVEWFGTQSGRNTNKFKELPHSISKLGNPILENTLGWLECQVETSMQTGDRTVYLAEIVSGRLMRIGRPVHEKEMRFQADPEFSQKLNDQLRYDSQLDREGILSFRSSNSQ